MKSFGTTCSVAHNSNRIVSSTQCHWGKVKKGSSFKFVNEDKYYHIVDVKDFRWTKNFTLKNKNTIVIDDNIFPNIAKKDNLLITYKEYELENINVVINKGENYKIGDLIYFIGGNLTPDLNTSVILKVTSVNSIGEVVDYEIFNKGKYLSIPDKIIETTSNGDGFGLQINASFKELDKRGWADREVLDIKYNGGQTVITILQSLPEGLPSGKLSVEKWEIYLDVPYILRNANVISESYEIINDFIPHIEIPKLIRGHTNPDVIINHGFTKIAQKLKELDDKIEVLNKKIEELNKI